MKITNDKELDQALALLDRMMPQSAIWSVIVDAVEAYEAEHHPIPPPTPEQARQFRRDQEKQDDDMAHDK